MKIVIFFILSNAFFSCMTGEENLSKDSSNKQISRESIPRSEIEEIKACNLKLDACINRCKAEYPSMTMRYPQWGQCKDSCINKTKTGDGCAIYYESVRSNKYRFWFAP